MGNELVKASMVGVSAVKTTPADTQIAAPWPTIEKVNGGVA